MLIDARSVPTAAEFSCDLCVVGAGPAGIAIVDRLRDSGLAVLLLESGGLNLELPTQALYRGEIHGHDYFRLDACRWRLFGGSSNRWGGWCRPLEAIDFARREWLPYSGWPIEAETLQPYHADAAELFELPIEDQDVALIPFTEWAPHERALALAFAAFSCMATACAAACAALTSATACDLSSSA